MLFTTLTPHYSHIFPLWISFNLTGGSIFIIMNQRYFTDTAEFGHKLESRMQELQEQGLWKLVLKKTDIPNYMKNNIGILFLLTICWNWIIKQNISTHKSYLTHVNIMSSFCSKSKFIYVMAVKIIISLDFANLS